MGNIYATPEKSEVKRFLFEAGIGELEKAGYKVDRVAGAGKSSIRHITKGSETKTVSIRTTQDTWIAFPRTLDDKGWATLDEVDLVVAVSVDDAANPRFAQVHFIPGDEVRARFNRAYKARKQAGHTITPGSGVWVSLYEQESSNPVNRVGAGAGLVHQPLAKLPFPGAAAPSPTSRATESVHEQPIGPIAAAKRRLAQELGVAEADIKITISS